MPFYTTTDTLFLGPMCAPVSWLDEEDRVMWSKVGTRQERCEGMPPPPVDQLRITTPNGVRVLSDDVLQDALDKDYFSLDNVFRTTWAGLLVGMERAAPPRPVLAVEPAYPLTRLFGAISVHGGAKRSYEPYKKAEPDAPEPKKAKPTTTPFEKIVPKAPTATKEGPNTIEIRWSIVQGDPLYELLVWNEVQRVWQSVIKQGRRVTYTMTNLPNGTYKFALRLGLDGKYTQRSPPSEVVQIGPVSPPMSPEIWELVPSRRQQLQQTAAAAAAAEDEGSSTEDESGTLVPASRLPQSSQRRARTEAAEKSAAAAEARMQREHPGEAVTNPNLLAALDGLLEQGPAGFQQFAAAQRGVLLRGEPVTFDGFSNFGNIPSDILRDLSDETIQQVILLWQTNIYVHLSCMQLLKRKAEAGFVPTEQGNEAIERYLSVSFECITQANQTWETNMRRTSGNKAEQERLTQELLVQWKTFIVQVGVPTPTDNSTTNFFWSLLMGKSELRLSDEAKAFLAMALAKTFLPSSIMTNWFMPVPRLFTDPVPDRLGERFCDDRSWTLAQSKGMMVQGFMLLYSPMRALTMLAMNFYLQLRPLFTEFSASTGALVESAVDRTLRRDQTTWSQVYEYLPATMRESEWWQYLVMPTDLVRDYHANGPGILIQTFQTLLITAENQVVVVRQSCIRYITSLLATAGVTQYVSEDTIQLFAGMAFDMAFVCSLKFVTTNGVLFLMSLTRRINQFVGRMGFRSIRSWAQRWAQRRADVHYLETLTSLTSQLPVKFRCDPPSGVCQEVRVPTGFTDPNFYDTEEACMRACELARLGAIV